ncbi:hypothetical protein COCCADRAFT_27191 [Bipolaris zeicola 26-R-13]|uniref:Uncharacterized protein n=1 Tax=Cochliobolus carbonum (strain 26-R-13) TaxID=930089 RepID=W6YLN2_COCC2|nr:uncharacterized protein COCCADRAFT_27191 [Bipolaris zeicola 26-R-13]EUC32251.1 hypothetical protein COCCADRAFT_27191 [Bipolaris zeicola 26-R-13]
MSSRSQCPRRGSNAEQRVMGKARRCRKHPWNSGGGSRAHRVKVYRGPDKRKKISVCRYAAALWSSSTTTTQSDDRHLVVVDLARGQPFPPVAPPPHSQPWYAVSDVPGGGVTGLGL